MFWIHTHLLTRAKQGPAVDSAESLIVRLPFTIPCAVKASDAGPVYAALHDRDRNALKVLFTDKKFVAVDKGIEVNISDFGAVSMIVIEPRSSHRPGICFVPAYIVPAIRRHASPKPRR